MATMIPIPVVCGDVFGRLRVSHSHGKNKYGHKMWYCTCECGNSHVVSSSGLRSGRTRSCGCLKTELVKTHGRSHSPEHKAWDSARQRCSNQKNAAYARYGGRGIVVCERWLSSFENFLADMGDKPSPQHSLDRVDNNGPYSPENCRWATKKDQNNNKRNNRPLTYNGVTKNLARWAEEYDMDEGTLSWRLGLGWSIEKVLETPVKTRGVKSVKHP